LALHNHNDKEDKELLQHFYNDGNNDWLGILLQRYTMLLFGVCMKYLKK
jgi:RNA polymerase sigma-70 factor (ECF subfamily)